MDSNLFILNTRGFWFGGADGHIAIREEVRTNKSYTKNYLKKTGFSSNKSRHCAYNIQNKNPV